MVEDSFGGREVLDKAVDAEFVEVMFASSVEEAKECCALLEDSHIPSKYEQDTAGGDKGVAILVAEEHFVEASELLASRVQHGAVEEEDEELVDDEDDDEIEAIDDDEDLVDDDDDDDDDDDLLDDDDDEDELDEEEV